MSGREPLEEKAARSIVNNYSKKELEDLKELLSEYIYAPIEKAINKQKYKDVMDHLPGFIEFNKKLKEIFSDMAMADLMGDFRFYLGPFIYRFGPDTKRFYTRDNVYGAVDIPFHKFYIFENIGAILLKYLSGEDEHLLRKVLIYYPAIGEKHPGLWKYTYNFGKKKKKKKKKKKLSSDIKKKCKKKGIRLTYIRNGKRIYKSEKVLRKQLSNRS
tara:strand:+ start:1996 stop:2640 length:645 start_codon:yes stop_codon:yes gene_type:complete